MSKEYYLVTKDCAGKYSLSVSASEIFFLIFFFWLIPLIFLAQFISSEFFGQGTFYVTRADYYKNKLEHCRDGKAPCQACAPKRRPKK